MPLTSRLFAPCERLNACLIKDSAHVIEGEIGAHVRRIQLALKAIDDLVISQDEITLKKYGKSTASAVLTYKTNRDIVNRAYQSKPDSIVGKMTIASLDRDMLALQDQPNSAYEKGCKNNCCYPRPFVSQLYCKEKFTLSLG
jgi:hypothetical protein